jgi:hypothetical protein
MLMLSNRAISVYRRQRQAMAAWSTPIARSAMASDGCVKTRTREKLHSVYFQIQRGLLEKLGWKRDKFCTITVRYTVHAASTAEYRPVIRTLKNLNFKYTVQKVVSKEHTVGKVVLHLNPESVVFIN